jgi:peptidyl-prolyl cis-trans isomerase SurA
MITKKDTISSKTIISEINKTSELNLKVLTNKYEIASTPFLAGRDLTKGLNKPYEYNGKFYVVYVQELLAPTTKELSECRGAAISDYQNHLESSWMQELKSKYPIVVHKDILYNLK